jgi:hypothetical protein
MFKSFGFGGKMEKTFENADVFLYYQIIKAE